MTVCMYHMYNNMCKVAPRPPHTDTHANEVCLMALDNFYKFFRISSTNFQHFSMEPAAMHSLDFLLPHASIYKSDQFR